MQIEFCDHQFAADGHHGYSQKPMSFAGPVLFGRDFAFLGVFRGHSSCVKVAYSLRLARANPGTCDDGRRA